MLPRAAPCSVTLMLFGSNFSAAGRRRKKRIPLRPPTQSNPGLQHGPRGPQFLKIQSKLSHNGDDTRTRNSQGVLPGEESELGLWKGTRFCHSLPDSETLTQTDSLWQGIGVDLSDVVCLVTWQVSGAFNLSMKLIMKEKTAQEATGPQLTVVLVKNEMGIIAIIN
jgi:hypothetical protein